MFNDLSASNNVSHADLFTPTSDSTGTLSLRTATVYNISGWSPVYTTRVGDIDGRNGADLVFVRSTDPTAANDGWIHRALNNGNGTFTIQPPQHAPLRANPTVPYLADFNNDGKEDILLNHLDNSTNQVLVGFGTDSGTFTFPSGVVTAPNTPPRRVGSVRPGLRGRRERGRQGRHRLDQSVEHDGGVRRAVEVAPGRRRREGPGGAGTGGCRVPTDCYGTQVVTSPAARRGFASGTAAGSPSWIRATIRSPSGTPTAARARGSSITAPDLRWVARPAAAAASMRFCTAIIVAA